jgi:hypothetical protein
MGFILRSFIYTKIANAIGLKCYIWNVALYGAEAWTHREV